MLIFGITGPINHGKTSLAVALAEQYPERSRHFSSFQLVATVANVLQKQTTTFALTDDISTINTWLTPLPVIIFNILHSNCSFEQIKLVPHDIQQSPLDYKKLFTYIERISSDPSLINNPIIEKNKEIYRPLLQWLGSYLVAKIDPGIWYKEIVRMINKERQAECQLCTVDGLRYPNDALLIRQAGGSIIEIRRPSVAQFDSDDYTERDRHQIKPDIIVINNGTIEDLRACAEHIINDIQQDRIQNHYNTKNINTF